MLKLITCGGKLLFEIIIIDKNVSFIVLFSVRALYIMLNFLE